MPDEALASDAIQAIRAIYADLDAELAALKVPCILRGDCCDFDLSPHMLYTSGPELDYFLQVMGEDRRPVRGRLCPYWVNRRCTAREARPLGCRVYFCDPAWNKSGKSAEVYERYLARLRAVAKAGGGEWRYAPFVDQLAERIGRAFE